MAGRVRVLSPGSSNGDVDPTSPLTDPDDSCDEIDRTPSRRLQRRHISEPPARLIQQWRDTGALDDEDINEDGDDSEAVVTVDRFRTEPAGDEGEGEGTGPATRRFRRPITEPPERFVQLLRETGALDDEDDDDKEGDAVEGEACPPEEELILESTPSDATSGTTVSKMPSRPSPTRSLRQRFESRSVLSQERRLAFQERRLRQLRFDLDGTGGKQLRRRLSDLPSGSTPRRGKTELGLKLLTWVVAGGFGLAVSYSSIGGLLWIYGGRRQRFRDAFLWDGDRDGTLARSEIAIGFSLYIVVLMWAFVVGQGVLAVYHYIWFGVLAIQQNRRAAELAKNSPFFISRSNSTMDHSMLEYLQSNYDSGPAVPTPMAAAGASDDSWGAMCKSTSSASQASRGASRRPSLRRDISETQRSASEFMSLDALTHSQGTPSESSEGEEAKESTEEGAKDGTESLAVQIRPSSFHVCSRKTSAARDFWRRETAVGQDLQDDAGNKLQELICKLANWNFDMFEIAQLTQRPLAFVGFVCLDAYSKLVDFDKPKLLEFLREVEGSYRKVPYHNSLHAASVTRCVYSFCAGCGLAFTQEFMEFTLVLAGLVHDVHHPGLTPSFLSRASMNGDWVSPITPPLEPADMEVSLKYNDQSPLENMHCAITFGLLKNRRTAFLSKEDVATMRKPLVRAILGTDMAKHAETMTRLAALIDNLEHEAWAVPWHWPVKPPATADEEQRVIWHRLYQEEFVMELFLHAADIGNPTLPFGQWCKWNRLVQQEFVLQGDRELLEFGELISPPAGFDRSASVEAEHGFTKGFMQYLSLPLFQKLHDLTQLQNSSSVCHGVNISGCLDNLRENLKLWDEYTPERDPPEPDSPN